MDGNIHLRQSQELDHDGEEITRIAEVIKDKLFEVICQDIKADKDADAYAQGEERTNDTIDDQPFEDNDKDGRSSKGNRHGQTIITILMAASEAATITK